MKNVLVHAIGRHSFFARSHRVHATMTLLGLFVCCRDASSQASAPGGRARFEAASVPVPAGNTCALHPAGSSGPAQSIPVRADQDGVARFQAVRPTGPDSVDQLALDCTDSIGNSQTYSVDLRSAATFAARPFDPALANLEYRPGLARDPLSYTQQELIQGGYGLRPDPTQNPDGYQRWVAAAGAPAYKLGSVRSSAASSNPGRRAAPRPSAGSTVSKADAMVNTVPTTLSGTPLWTGAILKGSYQKNATTAQTYSYVWNEATFNVPSVTPGGYENFNATAMSIWNGIDEFNLLQAEAWVYGATASYIIQHQEFAPWTSGNDHGGSPFTPSAGDTIYAAEWYCDAKGNMNLQGGYACTWMKDLTQGVVWDCTQASSSACPSYTLKPGDLANGNLGQTAEFIIENDTDEYSGKNAHEWPDFSGSPVTMTGSACIAKGSGVSGCVAWVTTSTDPNVVLQTDDTASIPFVRGDGHLQITLPTGGVKWSDEATNIYYWNGSNFNSYVPGCATSIGVGPNSRGLTNGTPWITGCTPSADGNHAVYQLQGFYTPSSGTQQVGTWVKMQDDIATQVAVSPEGIAWAIDAKGEILYWNGSEFAENVVDSPAGNGCATSIGVGPKSALQTNGTPWITGCTPGRDGNYSVYQLVTGGDAAFHLSSWVKMQDDVATQIAVSPEGIPWATNMSGDILYWNGSKFVSNPTGGCGSSIGVGPNSRGLTNGTPWITGCTPSADANDGVYQMQTGGAGVNMQNDVGIRIAVTPDANIAWAISLVK